MTIIESLPKLHYCDKKLGDTCTCANIATRQISMKSKKDFNRLSADQEYGYRCEEHYNTGTVNKSVYQSLPFDQSFALTKISQFLNSIIGKNIVSKVHTAKSLKVKFIKPNTGGVMCFQEQSKQWKFVYYHQISEVI